MPATLRLDHLEPIHELNRLFLGFLQSRARVDRDCLGLPASAHPPLRAADGVSLDDAAQFPRALFQLSCNRVTEAGLELAGAGERDARYHDVALPILWAARQTSRQSPYRAQFLLGLDVAQIEFLGSLAASDLARLAGAPDVLRCAFTDQDWVWRSLLTDRRPEARRQLVLVVLQPGLDRDWPQRRPAHPVI